MKLRFDFVTNSSSSSFVLYNITATGLISYVRELMKNGKIKESLYQPNFSTVWGNEACEQLNLNRDLKITLQICEMSAAPYSLRVCDAEQTQEYSENALRSDCIKMLDTSVVLCAIEGFFSLSQEEREKLNDLVGKAIADDEVSCGVFVDETDGFRGYQGNLYSACELQSLKKPKRTGF